MSNQNTLLVQAQGKTVPRDLVETLLKENGNSLGLAAMDAGTLSVTICEDLTNAKPKDVSDMLAEYSSKSKTILSFNNFKSTVEDIQPICVLFAENNKDKPLILAFLEGPFPNYAALAAHSPQYNAAMNYLGPKIGVMWDLVQPDLDKLMKALDKVHVHHEIEKEIGDAGTVILLGENGQMLQYGKINGKALTADWGWCSNTHGWAPHVAEAPKPVAQPTSMFAKKKFGSTATETKPATSVPDSPEKVIPQPDPTPAAPPDTSVAAQKSWPRGVWYDEKSKKIFAQCPDDIHGKEKREQWYQDHAGFVPQKYKNRQPGVTVEVRGSPFKALAPSLGGTASAGATGSVVPSGKKDTTAHNIPIPAVAERLPIVDTTVKENFDKWMATPQIKTMVEKKGMDDPKTFQDFEDKYPSFTDLTNIPLEQTFGYSFELRHLMCKDFPEMAAILMLNTVAAYARLLEHVTDPAVTKPKDAPAIAAAGGSMFQKRRTQEPKVAV